MFAAILQPRALAHTTGPVALVQPTELSQNASVHRPFVQPSVVALPLRAFNHAPPVPTAPPASAPLAYPNADTTLYTASLHEAQIIAPPLGHDAVLEEDAVEDYFGDAIGDGETNALPDAHKLSLAAEHLNLLRQGDGVAWNQFVTDWSPRLFSYLRYSLPTREDAEDALSETLVATVEAIKHFDGKSQVSTWLYSIARRKVADFWRKSSNTEELSDLFQAAPNGFSLEFREALAALPEQARQALLLRYREGFNVSEVSEIMRRTYKATESLLSRGRTLLARQLQLEAE